MQINVPHRDFGECTYFAPEAIEKWIKERGLRISYCGGNSSGNGRHEDGTSNAESTYMVRNIEETDSVVFKIMFPTCKVYSSEQYEY